jgi:hypothetical protein
MERIEKTVFLNYRRTDIPWALAIFQNLTQHGYDVFFDYNGIASGDFERVILGNITDRKARAKDLVAELAFAVAHVTPGSDRSSGEGPRFLRSVSTLRGSDYA